MSEIHGPLEDTVSFTREWFENNLKPYFNLKRLECLELDKCPLPSQREHRSKIRQSGVATPPFKDVDIVFLAGGTCRIPFVQEWIKEIFPEAEMIIDGELEIITATGAALHALQVLSGEVEPYIRITEENNGNSNHEEQATNSGLNGFKKEIDFKESHTHKEDSGSVEQIKKTSQIDHSDSTKDKSFKHERNSNESKRIDSLI